MNKFHVTVASAMLAAAASSALGANLLVNAGFEDPVLGGGDVFGAVGWNVFGGGTFTIKVAPRSGDNAFKTFGAASGAFQDFAASEGQMYKASAYALNPSFDAMAGAQIAAVNIEWRDAGNNLISFITQQILSASSPQGATALDYAYGEIMGVAPAGTATARFVIITGAFAGPGGGAPFFDDASFELIPAPSAALAGLLTVGVVAGRRRRIG